MQKRTKRQRKRPKTPDRASRGKFYRLSSSGQVQFTLNLLLFFCGSPFLGLPFFTVRLLLHWKLVGLVSLGRVWILSCPFAANTALMKHFAQDVGRPAHKHFSSALFGFCGWRTLLRWGRGVGVLRLGIGTGNGSTNEAVFRVDGHRDWGFLLFHFKREWTLSLN